MCMCYMGCPTCALWGTALHQTSGEKGIPQGPVFCLFLCFLCLSFSGSLLHNQVLTLPGCGMPAARTYRTACCCVGRLQVSSLPPAASAHASSHVICSSPAAVSPFGQRTFAWAHAQICLLSKVQRQRSVRKSCIFQAGLGTFVADRA